jgi:4-hydroxybenzoate polyprenyltransferase
MAAERAGTPPHRRAHGTLIGGPGQQAAADQARLRPASGGAPPRRLGRFVAERFPLPSLGVLTVALVLCGQAGATLAAGEPAGSAWTVLGASVAAGLVFLQLRILDDVRDLPVDRQARPERPLPRGLVTERELLVLAVACGLAGGVVAVSLGAAALAGYGLAAAQVWLPADRTDERLAGSRRLPASALAHSFLVPTVLALAWAASAPIAWSLQLAGALLLAWAVGLALEVGRKTVTPDEEREGIDTYSRALGRPRALASVALLLGSASAGAALLAAASGAPPLVTLLPGGLVVAGVIGAWRMPGRLTTSALRAMVPIAVLALLLWPPVLAWAS